MSTKETDTQSNEGENGAKQEKAQQQVATFIQETKQLQILKKSRNV